MILINTSASVLQHRYSSIQHRPSSFDHAQQTAHHGDARLLRPHIAHHGDLQTEHHRDCTPSRSLLGYLERHSRYDARLNRSLCSRSDVFAHESKRCMRLEYLPFPAAAVTSLDHLFPLPPPRSVKTTSSRCRRYYPSEIRPLTAASCRRSCATRPHFLPASRDSCPSSSWIPCPRSCSLSRERAASELVLGASVKDSQGDSQETLLRPAALLSRS